MLEIDHLSKRRGSAQILSDVSFTARPGRVTGFLGPNGAGKSSTLRILLGLDRPTSGTALVNGVPFTELRDPLTTLGAVLDGSGAHRARTGRAHLNRVAAAGGIPRRRAGEVLAAQHGVPGRGALAQERPDPADALAEPPAHPGE